MHILKNLTCHEINVIQKMRLSYYCIGIDVKNYTKNSLKPLKTLWLKLIICYNKYKDRNKNKYKKYPTFISGKH
jgi:hypothetical protein